MTLESLETRSPKTQDPPPGAAVKQVTAWRTAAWLSRQVELAVATVDLTLPQYRVLAFLSEGSSVSSALAQRLAVRPPSVTAVIDGMVARGLVQRRNVEDDRRCVRLALTAEGVRLLDAAEGAVDERMTALLEHLDDPAKVQRALDGLDVWREALVARANALARR